MNCIEWSLIRIKEKKSNFGGFLGFLPLIRKVSTSKVFQAGALGKEANSWSTSGPRAFMAGLEAMMQAGGAGKGARTMLDALLPAAEALLAEQGLKGAAEAAKAGAEATKEMKPKAGRSENVPESVLKGNADPGAMAASIFFDALTWRPTFEYPEPGTLNVSVNPCGSPSCIALFPKQGLGLPHLEGYKSHTLCQARGVELSAIGDFGDRKSVV